jgi:hypothetical protein
MNTTIMCTVVGSQRICKLHITTTYCIIIVVVVVAVQHKATSPPQSARKLRRTTVMDREFGSAFDPVADSAFPAICEERLTSALGLSEEL